MKKLQIFEDITERCYGEQVQSDDIREHLKNGQQPYQDWLESADIRTVSRKTADGYKLIASEIMAERDNHVWVLLLHGYTGWKEAMYPYAFWYAKRGYHALVPDLRAQGKSQGDYIGMGWTDHYDCTLWIDYILDQDPQAQIIIHGQSMGASTALMMSGEPDFPDQVKFIVSDCAYTDAYSMFGQKAQEWFHLPPFPVVDSACLMLRLRGGYDLKKADALAAVKKSHTPTLFIHGDQDAMISVEMSRKLYRAATCDKKLLIVEGAGHAQAQAKDPDGFYGAILEFVNTYLDLY
ncbi:MAG: alpha/beta hydrolase [Eubacterium sp.]|nr:alpha/beta hydrolase [Eubacterium sp.]